jgi:hypothetical protein
MRCRRCQGLMVPDVIEELPTQHCAWRCVGCGDLIDPVIVANRLTSEPVKSGARLRSLPALRS